MFSRSVRWAVAKSRNESTSSGDSLCSVLSMYTGNPRTSVREKSSTVAVVPVVLKKSAGHSLKPVTSLAIPATLAARTVAVSGVAAGIVRIDFSYPVLPASGFFEQVDAPMEAAHLYLINRERTYRGNATNHVVMNGFFWCPDVAPETGYRRGIPSLMDYLARSTALH